MKSPKLLLSLLLAVFVTVGGLVGCAPIESSYETGVSNLPTVASHGNMPSQSELGQAMAIQNRHTDDLLNNDGVIGTGTGVDENGEPIIYVFTKKAVVGNIPARLENVRTRIENIGEVKAFGKPGSSPKPTPGFRAEYRSPMWSGVSTGNNNECASGTIGCVVTKNGHFYLLSNNHVFARENHASIGESIVQPGRYDKNCGASGQVATLSEFVNIVYGTTANNTMDAAIAEISNGVNFTSQMAIGNYTPTATPQAAAVGMAVKKTGRTTGFTTGSVAAVNVTINVGYTAGTARFIGQIYISGRGFSDSGDSGSLIVESSSNNPVGLLFAGSRTSTIANPIGTVLTQFGVTVVPF